MKSRTNNESTVGSTSKVTLEDLRAAMRMRKDGLSIVDGESPSSEARATLAAAFKVMQALNGGTQAEEAFWEPIGRVRGSSHEQGEQETAGSAGRSLDATVSPDVDAIGTKVGSSNGRDEVSTA
jgi:hypothetical protein